MKDTFLTAILILAIGGVALISSRKSPSRKYEPTTVGGQTMPVVTEDQTAKEEYLGDMKELRTLTGPGNGSARREMADALHAKWSKRPDHRTYHALLMQEVVRQYAGIAAREREASAFEEHYAKVALQDADALPLWLEVALVKHVATTIMDRERMTPIEWSPKRREQMDYWLHAYRRIHSTIDPGWRPDETAFTPSGPKLPVATKGGSGMDPSHIEDPVARAAYIEALARHKEIVQRFREQQEARRMQEDFIPKAEAFIVKTYTYPPHDLDELHGLLNEYVADESARERILRMVKKGIQADADSGSERRQAPP